MLSLCLKPNFEVKVWNLLAILLSDHVSHEKYYLLGLVFTTVAIGDSFKCWVWKCKADNPLIAWEKTQSYETLQGLVYQFDLLRGFGHVGRKFICSMSLHDTSAVVGLSGLLLHLSNK